MSYNIFYQDFGESIFPSVTGPKLPNELHPLGVLLKGVNEASTTAQLQKVVDNYVNYRSKSKGEKVGKGATIAALFSEFKGLKHFTWKFKTELECDNCGETFIRTFDSDPLITIPSSSLIENLGYCSSSIKNSLESYLTKCPNDGDERLLQKFIITSPDYYCCILEYAEDISNGFLSPESIPSLKIDECIDFNNFTFKLAAIIYFQALHYTTHVKKINHPKFLPNSSSEWFYHDGVKYSMHLGKLTQGLLFQNTPSLNINVNNNLLKPYILIYKIVPSNI